MSTDTPDAHFLNSTLRERIVEHVFVGDALRRLWQLGITDVELLRSEFDAGGYDLVMTRGDIVRHIQLKTSTIGSSTRHTTIGLKLMAKPSGCVIWIMVTPSLELGPFLWFGAAPGEPLSDITDLKIAKHARANSQGLKSERPAHRIVPMKAFEPLPDIDGVLERLFGPLQSHAGSQRVHDAQLPVRAMPSHRNPPWIREELILALDFYLRNRDRLPPRESEEVRGLQRAITAVAKSRGLTGEDSFRNLNGVYMKLMNLRRLDPNYSSRAGAGLKQGGKLEEKLWEELAETPEKCLKLATIIKAARVHS